LRDPTFDPNRRLSVFDRLALRLINDVRDLPFVRLTVLLTLVVTSATFYFFLLTPFNWWIAAACWASLYGALVGPYILMIHNISHRPLFKPGYRWLNIPNVWLLGPYFALSPNTYYGHHIGMHHPENNLEDDVSSTMSYQRDSFLDFLRYFGRFYTTGAFALGRYLWRQRRFKLFRKALIGEVSYFVLIATLLCIDWQATLVLFIVPLIVSRFGLVSGNWAQHAFIDATDPANNYRNSITCINSAYNRRCFNDGYHIGHHLDQHLHWTDMPQDFLRNRESYHRERALVFERIDFLMIWAMLMLKRYDWLARFYVPLGDSERSQDEIVALLKERTGRICCRSNDSVAGHDNSPRAKLLPA
jgi:hypothetical protein